ncbi:hypothetical protein EST38_g2897 [Candolleomyces aberdarensis]|uniref:Metal-dependent protein hydrolase n=1 Tax=Candolleomyces aberdarensis TaxID=2316362 RepID=A0A4V1Q4R0_9AGAR|nr:hypothetical protein EST38_g2897 [Candolleomyces aberdarensis]
MYTRLPLVLLLLPLAVLAQDTTSGTRTSSGTQPSGSTTGSQTGNSTGTATTRAPVTTVITSTVVSEFTTVSNGQTRTGNATRVFTTTSVVAETTQGGATTTRSTSTRPLSSAPTGVDGGGAGADGAPLPGATGHSGEVYGPDDSYIAAASSIQKNGLLVGAVAFAVGGALTLITFVTGRRMSTSANEPQAKRQKVMSKVIGTHSGTFHCDEALAVFLLKQTEAYRGADVVRTRDSTVLDGCDIVVDVGAVYDPAKQRFDHHQRGFSEVLGLGFTTKLSSAGLVYKHFGHEIIAKKLGVSVEDEKVNYVYKLLYRDFIEALDAIDNGISQYPTEVEPRYRNKTDLSSRVGRLNPRWNQEFNAAILDERFKEASALTGKEFTEQLDFYAESWLPARDLVTELVNYSKANFDSSGKILLFEKFVPWKEHLFDLEKDAGNGIEEGAATYIVYPDEGAKQWRIQAVPVAPQSFESRKALPEPWRGIRDDELSNLTGIDGGVFVHASGFIGGNKTKDGALQMAKKALEF